MTEKISKLKKEEVIDWYGNVEQNKLYHAHQFGFGGLYALDLEN
ncbi:MAG TPA: hypothetical protein PLK15_01250 [Chitinophagales bacterium]|nr:hypothetical protein [Chitinophagales bacterium]